MRVYLVELPVVIALDVPDLIDPVTFMAVRHR